MSPRSLSAVLASWMLCAGLLAAGMAAHAASDSGAIAVSATVISKNECKFAAANLTLALGSIDPSSTLSVSRSITTTIRCGGSAASATYFITTNDGLYPAGTNAPRMRHATLVTQFLPYTLTVSPASATVPKNVDQTITITGTVAPSGFQSAAPGAYSDTVVITLTP